MIAFIQEYLLVFVTTFVCAISFVLWFLRKSQVKLPPGPKGYPLIGNVRQLKDQEFREVLAEYRETYGDIYTLNLLGTNFVVCSGYEVLNDILVKNSQQCNNRPVIPIWDIALGGKGEGIVFSTGDKWRRNRRFANCILRDFGVGKNQIELKIHHEIRNLIERIEKFNGESFDPRPLLHKAICNIVSSLVLGKRSDYDDEDFNDFIWHLDEMLKIPFFFKQPWFRYIPGDPLRVKRFINIHSYLSAIYRKKIKEHFQNFDEDNIRDLIDVYIKQMKESHATEAVSSTNIDDLVRVMDDFFVAGTETTATALRWGLVYLLRDTQIQENIQKELDINIPPDRLPAITDKPGLPNLQATILEILRMGNTIPVFTRAVTNDIEYRGYTIPKSTFIVARIESVHLDDRIWEKPHIFNPSRFLNNSGLDKKFEELIPFGLGARVCLGESLARTELYLFLSALLQRFKFVADEDQGPPSLESNSGLTLTPIPFKVRAIKRCD